MKHKTLFLTVANRQSIGQTKLMLESLRTFGGELKDVPFWVFSTEPETLKNIKSANTRIVPLTLHDPGNTYLFERKITACATGEVLAPTGTDTLVWVDAGVIFTAPPLGFMLDKEYDAAFRPVHIRNVGLPLGEPLDAFWKGICAAVGVEDVPGAVTSFVDEKVLRTYYNTHAFSFRPGLGLMAAWLSAFLQLSQDVHFQAAACQDEAHQVFLFQALLSTLIATRLGSMRVKLLPPVYNYPYNLQERIPAGKRLGTLNETVCFVYEDKPVHPEKLRGIDVNEPFKGWLAAHAPR